MSESPSQAGKETPAKKQKLSSDENSNPDVSGDENVRNRTCGVSYTTDEPLLAVSRLALG